MSSPTLSAIDPATSSSHGDPETQGTATSPHVEDSNVLSTRQINDENAVMSCTTNIVKSLTCLCYNDQATRIIEIEIDSAHYRLQMGVIDSLEALEKARSRASDFTTAAAQDAMRDVLDDLGHEQRTCKPGKTAHLKGWQRRHVEWNCDRATGEFHTLMKEHPRRKHYQPRLDREIASEEAKGGGKEERTELERTDDVRDLRLIITLPISCTPYPACECALWGAAEIASTAWNKAVSSFDGMHPVASDWGDLLLVKIEESTEAALEEIRDLVSESGAPKGRKAGVAGTTPKDHLPEWQQVIVQERVDIAVDEAKKRITLGRGVLGAVAKAEAKDAGKHYYQHRTTVAAKEAARNSGGGPRRVSRLRKGRMVDLQQWRRWWEVRRPHEMVDWKSTRKGTSVKG